MMSIINKTITNLESIYDFIEEYKRDTPFYTSLDTETTGLNIVKDTPFLYTFGYAVMQLDSWDYKTWLLDKRDVTEEVWYSTLYAMQKLFSRSKYVVGHNIKYDLHMSHNIGFPEMFTNVTDTQIVIRLTNASLTRQEGGVPDDLTGFATRYIDKNAINYQRKVRTELTRLKREQTKKLLDTLNKEYLVPEIGRASCRERV